MKKLFKALAVLAAVAVLGFGFAACANDSDSSSSSSSSALATFVYTESYGTETIYFYSDNTWKCYEYKSSLNYTGNDYNGTYSLTTGDFTNGTMDFTVVDHNGTESGWAKVSVTITNGVFYIDVWDSPASVSVNDTSDHKYVKQ